MTVYQLVGVAHFKKNLFQQGGDAGRLIMAGKVIVMWTALRFHSIRNKEASMALKTVKMQIGLPTIKS